MATIIGYEISCDDIMREAKRQEEERETLSQQEEAREAKRQTVKTVGRFSFDPSTGTISGPSAYMAERYTQRMAAINSGKDTVANMGFSQHGDTVLAVLVSLQTDFAAWCGMREFEALRRK